ncbi:DUF5590 domain-containing protein [Streptococcus pantholopis]|uniref:Cell wall elongation regulator TseB-like domain-containing protein n=1 Tax=Streptococcus pantholopis TaxID=1811193 RepID=A0A172Q6G5_9STRE|nr:DUF5590 domain-containing protein [Streptococcus pantholopis]AND79041.1 hypothetical protein A0O21_02890 [Streptococcus pantholopis]
MKKAKLLKWSLFAFSLSAFLVLLAVFLVLFFAMKPSFDAQHSAEQIAKKRTNLVHFTDFQLYHGKETYYSLFGTTKSGIKEVVAIAKNSQKVYTYRLNSGISQKQARQAANKNGAKKIKTITFGVYDDFPIWEVAAENGYYLIDFETGDFIKKN